MLKKYGKAIEQPQGALPLHLHSEQMDGRSRVKEEVGSKSPCAEWSLALPPEGWGLCSCPQPCFLLGSHPLPSTERGLLRKAGPRELEGLRSRRWGGQGRPRQALLAVCALGSLASGWRSSGALGGSPSHLTSCDLATFMPLGRAGPTFLRRQWSKIERQSQPAVLYKKGAIDSGISETNLTLVFRLFQTIKIKAGLRWLPSSESCYVFLIWQG